MPFFESISKGTPASQPDTKFYKSKQKVSGGDDPNGTYLEYFKVDSSATSFEIIRG